MTENEIAEFNRVLGIVPKSRKKYDYKGDWLDNLPIDLHRELIKENDKRSKRYGDA